MTDDENMFAGQRRFTSVEAFRREHGLGRALTYAAIRRGDLPHVRIGNRILVPTDALDWLLRHSDPAYRAAAGKTH